MAPEATDKWHAIQEPKFIWCLHSLRQSISQWDPLNDQNFQIVCPISGINTARCNICFKDSDACDMVGNEY